MASTIQTIETPKRARALDTSGNNNHGQIYSGRALEFDGVTDYFQHNGGTVLNGVNQFNDGVAWTFATWVYFNDASGTVYLVGDDNANYSHIGLGSGYLIFRSDGADHFRWTSTKLNEDTWYRVVIVATTDTTLTAYVNGVQYGSTLTASSTAYDGSNPTLTAEGGTKHEFTGWGMPYVSGTRKHGLDGMMSNGQVWNAAWTAADVTYDYLNPESLALNRGGTSLTNSNLKIWYPMQDGHRGNQAYILDASNTGLGAELVSEGDFGSGGANWTVETGWTDTGGSGAWDTTGTSNRVYQTINALVVGKSYKLTFKISNSTDGRQLVRLQGATNQDVVAYTEHSNSEHTVYFTSLYANTVFSFYGHADYGSFNVDDISLKPVNDKTTQQLYFMGMSK